MTTVFLKKTKLQWILRAERTILLCLLHNRDLGSIHHRLALRQTFMGHLIIITPCS